MTRLFVSAAITGLIGFALLLAVVFATGSTFGQRCTTAGYEGQDHVDCVWRLAKGHAA